MNDPHSLPDSGISKTDGTFLFSDWDLSGEKSPADSATLFDGKIIARMPDLGSETIVKTLSKTIETPRSPSFGEQVRASMVSVLKGGMTGDTPANPVARQQFFHRVTAIGAVVLLCGFGILFFGTDNDPSPDKAVDETKLTKSSVVERNPSGQESAFSSLLPAESGFVMPGVPSHSAIPVAPIERVAAVSPPVSPWDRPAANSFSPWDTPPSQPGNPNPFQPIEVAPAPPVPPGSVVMSPMTPIGAAAVPTSMVPNSTMPTATMPTAMMQTSTMPVSPHEMPVSPHEVPLVASNYPTMPSGMMPMQGRQENAPGGIPPHNTAVPPQYPPSAHAVSTVPGHPTQGYPIQGHPMYGPGVPNNNPQHGHYGQQSQQYAFPPGYIAPNNHFAPPAGTPIPSGVSTLPPQGGQYVPPHGMPMQNMQPLGTPPMTRPPSDFYYTPPYNPPPTSRLM